ncbi:MAG: adenine phosphoribosyltransferase [Actinomycetota bacterium]
MTSDPGWLRDHIVDVPDHPEPGIVFKDWTPLLAHVDAFRFAVDALADHYAGTGVDLVVGIEARGFVLAAPLAYRLGVGLIPARKEGKLPRETASQTYDLEYGTDTLEIHDDALGPGHRVLLIDDVLATGGTAAAAAELISATGADVTGVGFLMELGFLDGRDRLDGHDVHSVLLYE